MFHKKFLKSQGDPSRKQTNWNTWISVCAMAIIIAVIVFIELHIRRLTVHSALLGWCEFLWLKESAFFGSSGIFLPKVELLPIGTGAV